VVEQDTGEDGPPASPAPADDENSANADARAGPGMAEVIMPLRIGRRRCLRSGWLRGGWLRGLLVNRHRTPTVWVRRPHGESQTADLDGMATGNSPVAVVYAELMEQK
jgi:hypothetical protein